MFSKVCGSANRLQCLHKENTEIGDYGTEGNSQSAFGYQKDIRIVHFPNTAKRDYIS